MKSILILSAVSTLALAQSNPLIPNGISSGCTSFLTALNSDATLADCIAPIITASAQFGPGSNSSSTPSVSAVSTALTTLCASSATGSCSDSTVRSKLADFYTACTAELTGTTPNTDVLRTYDVLYALTPLKTAVCSKDDTGKWCVTEVNAGSTPAADSTTPSSSGSPVNNAVSHVAVIDPSPLDVVKNNLWETITGKFSRRAEVVQNATSALVPNTTTYHDTNIAFLFLSASTPSASLCAPCTRNVLTAYINFEESVPYAPGLTASQLLGGQGALYQAVQSKCGANFMGGAVQAAGGLGGGILGGGNSGALRTAGGEFGYAAALLLAVAVGFATLF